MTRRRKIIIMILPLTLVTIIIYIIYLNQYKAMQYTYMDKATCIESFHKFAYEGPPRPRINATTLITPPWQPQLVSENIPNNGYPYSLYRTTLARSLNEQAEIWIELSDGMGYHYLPQSDKGREGFGIYSPDTQNFEVVSHYVKDTDLYVVDLYLDSQGTVWGEVRWDWSIAYTGVTNVPVLSKFNENTRRFEFAKGILEVPIIQNSFNYQKIVLDYQGIFWIFTNNGEIYRYDPLTQVTQKQGDITGGPVMYTTLSPQGDIFFTTRDDFNSLFISPISLFRYSPTKGEMFVVEVPKSDWPMYSGLLIDRSGQLWLGAIGFRDINDEWQLLYSQYIEIYKSHLGEYMWSTPQIIFESSDGRLWFSKFLDSGGIAEGTAWFDPKTKAGCLITTLPTTLVEDSEQRLWIVVDGTLYSSDISSEK